jgi:hypothetical protein
MRSLVDASLGRCVPWTMRPLDDASLGRRVPWTTRPLNDASFKRKSLNDVSRPLTAFRWWIVTIASRFGSYSPDTWIASIIPGLRHNLSYYKVSPPFRKGWIVRGRILQRTYDYYLALRATTVYAGKRAPSNYSHLDLGHKFNFLERWVSKRGMGS